jgi:citrate synthase
VAGFLAEDRPGFEETCYLLLGGELPGRAALADFGERLGAGRKLPDDFVHDSLLKLSSRDVMNAMAQSILALYVLDDRADDVSLANVMRQCLRLIATFPLLAAYSYQASAYRYAGKSLVIHAPQPDLSTAENFLHMLRDDNRYTPLEARLLDLALVLHAEHGGGNNSSFTIHVVTSSGTDTYSAIAAAMGSLKGPRHGGANAKVVACSRISSARCGIGRTTTRSRSTSAPAEEGGLRSNGVDLRHRARGLFDVRSAHAHPARPGREAGGGERPGGGNGPLRARGAVGAGDHRPRPQDVQRRQRERGFYSGFLYRLLAIPPELFTPIFAMARIAGWSAHRLEELANGGKIIRPAYKSVAARRGYVPLAARADA